MTSMDPEELSRWFAQWGGPLALYARQWLGEAHAEDVVQEAFIGLMGQQSRGHHVKAWLFTAVRNGAISQQRRRQARRRHEQQFVAGRKGWFEARPDDLIDAETAQSALESLPATQREVVVLRLWGQMSYKEIAAITGEPISTMHSWYQAALEAIKKRLESPCKTKKT